MTPDQLKVLDQLRQRLSQLSTSVQTLQAELERSHPLPSWTSLQSSAQLLAYNLQQLGEMLAANASFLRSAHAYPLTSYPGHSHPFIIDTLLSKKLAPRAEEWIHDVTGDDDAEQSSNPSALRLNEDFAELWNWSGPAESQILRQMLEDGDFEDDFTVAERAAGIETVATGLKRKLDGAPSDDDEDDDDTKAKADSAEVEVMEVDSVPTAVDISRPALPLENVLRFLSTGDIHSHLPPQRR